MEAELEPDHPTIRLAEKIVQLLDRGGFTATYKYAVLVGLIDLCLERTTATGLPPSSVTTRELAKKVIELYWPHCAPYYDHEQSGQDDHRVLHQSTGGEAKPATIVMSVLRFRQGIQRTHDRSLSLARARQIASEEGEAYEQLVYDVEWTLIHMPLPRLQRVGRQEDRFLYEYKFTEETPRGVVQQYQRGGAGPFNNVLDLKPGVGAALITLNGVLRPLIYRSWTEMVARMNKIKLSKLEEFLVGRPKRVSLEPVREDLLVLQEHRCFYCQKETPTVWEVDHFMPWARHADNSIDNLVVAHKRCNNSKSDFLACGEHVARWCGRSRHRSNDLAYIARQQNWESEPRRTFSVARAIYSTLSGDARLWESGDNFVPIHRKQIRDALALGTGT